MRNLISRNIYALNKCPQNTETKMIELKGELGNSKIRVGNFNSPLRKTRQKISKLIEKLNNFTLKLTFIKQCLTAEYFKVHMEILHINHMLSNTKNGKII